MSFWKYVIKTDWNHKKKDWREYCEMRNRLVQARNDVQVASFDIALCHEPGMQGNDKQRACINYYEFDSPVFTDIADRAPWANIDIRYCPLFLSRDSVYGCYKLDCEYINANRRYVELLKERNKLQAKLQRFWFTKFALAR